MAVEYAHSQPGAARRRGSVSKGPSINVLCQKVQSIETVKVDTDWCVYKPAENAHVRFRMPRAFRSRQFLIDLALKGSLHFPTVIGPVCSVGDLCAFCGPGRTHLCAVGKPVCGFWGLEERTGAFVRAFLGTWKKALRRAFMQCGGRPVCILGAWKNADWG